MKNIPIVIGFSGHRDTGDQPEDRIKAVVKSEINKIRTKYKNTSLVFMNGVATGFDTIVFDVAMEMDIPFISLLPKTLDDYSKDHGQPEKLHEMIEQSYGVIEIQEFIKYSGDGFDQKYEGLGQFLSVYSDILITFWNKIENPGGPLAGGTEDVVSIRRGISKSQNIDERFKNYGSMGPLLVIDSKDLTCEWIHKFSINTSLDKMNKKKLEFRGLSNYSEIRNAISRGADKLKKGHLRMLKWLFACAIGALIFFEAFDYLPGKTGLYAFLSLNMLFMVSYKVYQKTNYHQTYVDFRLLSEFMRISSHWTDQGMTGNLNKIISYKNHEMIRPVLEIYYTIYLLVYLDHKNHVTKPEISRTNKWFESQFAYFDREYQKQSQQVDKTAWMESGIIVAFLLVGVVTFFIEDLSVISQVVWLIGVFTASLGVIVAYRSMSTFKEQADGYRYMREVHKEAQALYEDKTFTEIEALFEYVSKIALEENIDWYKINSEKKGQFSLL